MAEYTAIFTKPYADGYEDLPSQNTPITAQTLNDKDAVIENIESYLSGNDIPSDAEELSYDNTVSGMTADNVQSAIDELNDAKAEKTYNVDYLKSKNLYDMEELLDVSGWNYSDGVYSGSASNFATYYNRNTGNSLIAVKPNTVYTLSIKGYSSSDSDGIGIGFFYTDGTRDDTGVLTSTESTKTVTSNPNKTISKIHGYYTGGATCYVEYIQIEEGSTATTYAPYIKSNVELDSLKADKTTIATEETGATASKAYAVGEHFIRNGKFCTAKTAIASGATFTLNTNYVEGTVADSLIKQDTFSGTTDGYGNIALTEVSTGRVPIVVIENTPYYASVIKSGSKYYAHMTDANGNAGTNASVSGVYYYIL